jgi:two-component system LytT family response regulator
MVRTVIVEDEPYSREHLVSLVTNYCKQVEIVGEAWDVKSGFDIISANKPDLVLLDIEMPDGTGFDLLQKFQKIDFEIIFTTAFAEYAVKAFHYSAIHYLLKPIDPDELLEAVKKTEELLQRKTIEARLNTLFHNLQNQKDGKRMVLSSGNNMYVINTGEIIMCHSAKNYTLFFLLDGRNITVSKTIKEYDKLLTENGFFRVHKQYLINIDHVKSFDKSDGGSINLTNDLKVPISIRKRGLVMELLGKINCKL